MKVSYLLSSWLTGIRSSLHFSQELGRQLEAAAQAARMAMEADAAGGSAGTMQASSDAPDATRSNRSAEIVSQTLRSLPLD